MNNLPTRKRILKFATRVHTQKIWKHSPRTDTHPREIKITYRHSRTRTEDHGTSRPRTQTRRSSQRTLANELTPAVVDLAVPCKSSHTRRMRELHWKSSSMHEENRGKSSLAQTHKATQESPSVLIHADPEPQKGTHQADSNFSLARANADKSKSGGSLAHTRRHGKSKGHPLIFPKGHPWTVLCQAVHTHGNTLRPSQSFFMLATTPSTFCQAP